MILEQTYKLLKTKYKDQMETLTISDVRIGVLLSAVLLSDGSCGVSSTVTDTLAHCDKKSRDYGDFSPLKITGHLRPKRFIEVRVRRIYSTVSHFNT
jgi:hypothetical protein